MAEIVQDTIDSLKKLREYIRGVKDGKVKGDSKIGNNIKRRHEILAQGLTINVLN